MHIFVHAWYSFLTLNAEREEIIFLCVFAYQKCDKSADGRLEHEEIEVFCWELLRRPELDGVFQQYSANGYILSAMDLREFLKDQGEDHTFVHAQSLILTYELNDWGIHTLLSMT